MKIKAYYGGHYSKYLLITDGHGAPDTSLESLFLCLTTLMVKIFFPNVLSEPLWWSFELLPCIHKRIAAISKTGQVLTFKSSNWKMFSLSDTGTFTELETERKCVLRQ